MAVFGFSLIAHHGGTGKFYNSVGTLEAANRDEAVGKGHRMLNRAFPVECGYELQKVIVFATEGPPEDPEMRWPVDPGI